MNERKTDVERFAAQIEALREDAGEMITMIGNAPQSEAERMRDVLLKQVDRLRELSDKLAAALNAKKK